MMATDKHKEAHDSHNHAVPLRILVGVWAILIVLTWLTVSVTRVDLGNLNIVVALTIAVIKSTFVALYFMHLRWDKPFNAFVFVGALAFVTLFISFALLDTKEYAPDTIPGYAPGVEGGMTLAGVPAGPPGSAPAAGAGHGGRGQELYENTCVTCHGDRAQGIRELNSPALHLQEHWYLEAQLRKFRDGLRGKDPRDTTGAQMSPMAANLPDEDITALAAYISSMEGPLPTPEVEGDPKAGRSKYLTCATCHGLDGLGKPDLKTPALVGQNDWYVVAQLEKFHEGIRGSHPEDIEGLQMKGMAITVPTDQDKKDVAAYIATLSR